MIVSVCILLLLVPLAPTRLRAGTVPCPNAGTGTAGFLPNMIIPNAFACPGSFSFRDDFNYASMNDLVAAGWTTFGCQCWDSVEAGCCIFLPLILIVPPSPGTRYPAEYRTGM